MKSPQMLSASRRPLTEKERRLLRAKSRTLTRRGRRASVIAFPVTGGGVLLLWLWTIVASDVNWVVVTMFWVIMGAGIALWVRREMRTHARNFETMSGGLDSALRRNAVDVCDVRSRWFAELEEIEDEGACYAFEMDDDRIVFIQGQEFYESARFPSLDFSLVYVLNEADQIVDMLIDKRGAKAAPVRRIPAAVKQRLDVPGHLEVRRGRIADLEDILGGSSQGT
jgi:hypothetical protein